MKSYFLDGKPIRFKHVPRERLPDLVVVENGQRSRPYRFVDIDESPFRVVK